jgi:hypothetical protein
LDSPEQTLHYHTLELQPGSLSHPPVTCLVTEQGTFQYVFRQKIILILVAMLHIWQIPKTSSHVSNRREIFIFPRPIFTCSLLKRLYIGLYNIIFAQ